VPKTAYYTDQNGAKRTINVTEYEFNGSRCTPSHHTGSTNDGKVFYIPRGETASVTIPGLPCGFSGSITAPSFVQQTLDVTKSLSYYCTATGKGKHYIQAKGGVPPYTYTFYNGPKDSGAAPIPGTHTKTSAGGVTFDWGEEGQTYSVAIKDACGQLTITNNLTVLKMDNLVAKLGSTLTSCSGEEITLAGQNFPVAAYKWTLPPGSARALTAAQKANRILTLDNLQPTDAGIYTLDISPADCAINIRTTYTLNVDHIAQPATTATNQTICRGTPVTLSPGASTAKSNSTPGSVTYQWYESRNGVDFTPINSAQSETYTYPGQQLGTRYLKRRDTYKACSKETAVNVLKVTESPVQTFKASELVMKAERNQRFTLPEGKVQPSTGVTYLWERSDDGVSWTPVGTDFRFEETMTFPYRQRKVFYRRTVTLGNCSVTSPNIRVQFPTSHTPMINPHLRLRVKK
jgi:hypothetical protein